MSEKTRAIVAIAAIALIVGGWFAYNTVNAPDLSVPVNFRAPISSTAAK